MKLYAITQGEYSDYHICALTSDIDRAKRIQKLCSCDNDIAQIEEYNDSEIVERSNFRYDSEYDYVETISDLNSTSKTSLVESVIPVRNYYLVNCYSDNEEHARKKAQDMIAKYKAEKAGL